MDFTLCRRPCVFVIFFLMICLNLFSQVDVVIPSCEKDLLTLDLAIDSIRKNGVDVGNIYVISEYKLSEKAYWINEKAFPFSRENIKKHFCNKKNEDQTDERIASRIGWYHQQLLKLYAHKVILGLSENFLILDSDTIFLRKTEFVTPDGTIWLNIGKKRSVLAPYVSHLKKILPTFQFATFPVSGISHHMVFNKTILDELFLEIEARFNKQFWEIYLCAIKPEHYLHSGASEYEIFFYYSLIKFPERVCLRSLNWIDISDLRDLQKLIDLYDFVSCHSYMRVL